MKSLQKKKKIRQHGTARPGTQPSYSDLCPALLRLRSAIARISWATCSFTEILTTVRAYPGGNILHDQGHAVTVKGDSCRTLFVFVVFADYALHNFFRLELSDDCIRVWFVYCDTNCLTTCIIVCHYTVKRANVHHSRDKTAGIGKIIGIIFF